MKKPKITKRDVVIRRFIIYCPICDIEITGGSSTHVEYNLKLHLEKCKKKKKGAQKKMKWEEKEHIENVKIVK